jgi:hypothetical protein
VKGKNIIVIQGDLDCPPLAHLKEHSGYCETVDDVLRDIADLRKYGHRFEGAWKVTIEKVEPRVVKTWRKLALTKSKEKLK